MAEETYIVKIDLDSKMQDANRQLGQTASSLNQTARKMNIASANINAAAKNAISRPAGQAQGALSKALNRASAGVAGSLATSSSSMLSKARSSFNQVANRSTIRSTMRARTRPAPGFAGTSAAPQFAPFPIRRLPGSGTLRLSTKKSAKATVKELPKAKKVTVDETVKSLAGQAQEFKGMGESLGTEIIGEEEKLTSEIISSMLKKESIRTKFSDTIDTDSLRNVLNQSIQKAGGLKNLTEQMSKQSNNMMKGGLD